MKLYLVTHAHTEQMPDVAVDAWRLSARGREEAVWLATAPFWESIDRIVVSSKPKTWATVANVVSKKSVPVWVDSRFDELRRSGWTENYADQVAAVFAEPGTSVKGWEAANDVLKRVQWGIAELLHRFSGETLALVGHGLCLSLLRAQILGDAKVDFSAWQRLQFGSYALVSLKPPIMIQDFAMSDSPQR